MQNPNGYYNSDSSSLSDTQSFLDSDIYDYELIGDESIITDRDIYSEQLKAFLPHKRYAHPLIILALMVMCFPVGIIAMICFTRWGAFPKILVTLFVLTVAVAIYEILVAKNVLLLPSLFDLLSDLFSAA